MDIDQLDKIYKSYNFKILPVDDEGVRVYAHKGRYFSNSDLVIINTDISEETLKKVKTQITQLGYNVRTRHYDSIIEAEESLFDGFFDIEGSVNNLKKSYEEYKSKLSDIILRDYEYIKSDYYDYQTEVTTSGNIIQALLYDFSLSGPLLIMLEAAAGFGKTSTSYEFLNSILNIDVKKIPLFTELSRNRRASIFKYVLYDEIDKKFHGVNLDLVTRHIMEGRIPVIIDGFDELLKSPKDKSDDNYSDAEPMLETIKELLQGEAKILLTTRKTAIFAGDHFHKWLNNNSSNFSFKRYAITLPTVSEWISPTREKALEKAGLNIVSISNPVLLSYIKSLNDSEFDKAIENLDSVINEYMNQLMLRERDRHELDMTIDEQKTVLNLISEHFIYNDITSENREVIEKLILQKLDSLLLTVIERYPAKFRNTAENIVSKILLHAFLDRKNADSQQIGFVNEFMLGNFTGENLINSNTEWVCTERFVDFILTSYMPRGNSIKSQLYDKLSKVIMDMLPINKIIFIDNYLFGGINRDIHDVYIEGMEFVDRLSYGVSIENCQFLYCDFKKISFDFDKIKNVRFINCSFYDCAIDYHTIKSKEINFVNCKGIDESLVAVYDFLSSYTIESDVDEYERKVLERFWPPGKDRFALYKRRETLRLGVPSQEIEFIDEAINSLIRKGVIIERRGQYSIELDINYIEEIKKILGR